MPDEDPIPGLALDWREWAGILRALVTCEARGSVRTDWFPITLLEPRDGHWVPPGAREDP
jgi:hypothetical protein